MRRGQLLRRAEALAVDRDRLLSIRRREMRGERKRQPEDRRRAARRTCSSPGSRSARRARRPAPPAPPGPASAGSEILHQLDDVLRELVDIGEQVAAHRPRGQLVRAGRAAEPQLDAARDAAPPACRTARRSSSGAWFGSMMPPAPIRMWLVPAATCASATAVAALAMPGRLWCSAIQIAPIAERLDMPRQIERVAQRLAGIAAFGDRREVENRERNHAPRYRTGFSRRKAPLAQG